MSDLRRALKTTTAMRFYPAGVMLALTGESRESFATLRRRGQIPLYRYNPEAGRTSTLEEEEQQGYSDLAIFATAVARELRVGKEMSPTRAATIARGIMRAPFDRLVPGYTEGPDVFLAEVNEDDVQVGTLADLEKFIASKATSVVLVNLHRVVAQMRARAAKTGLEDTMSGFWADIGKREFAIQKRASKKK